MKAVAAYIVALRNEKHETQEQVACGIGVVKRNITSWEKGKHLPHYATLVQLIEYLGGNPLDVHRLMLNPKATEDDGRTAASRWLSVRGRPEDATRIFEALERSNDDRRALAERLRELADQAEGR